MNFRYPIFLDLTGKKCLVAGEGFEVAGKVQALVDAAAVVVYVNPRAEPAIEVLAASGLLEWRRRDFQAGDLEGCFLVITDQEDNQPVFALAERQNILCNSVDDPPFCRFSFGSLHRQGDLTMSISTNGVAPAMAVRLKEWLRHEVGPEYGQLLAILKNVRQEITSRIEDFEQRKSLWYRIVDSDVLSRLRDGQEEEARQTVQRMIDEAIQHTTAHRGA